MPDTEEKPQVVDKRRFTGQVEARGSSPTGRLPEGAFSPSSDPNKPSTMDFGAASRLVAEGRRVTKLSWDDPEIYLIMFMWGNINPKTPPGKYLSIHHADGNMNPLYLNDGDLLGDDWVVV